MKSSSNSDGGGRAGGVEGPDHAPVRPLLGDQERGRWDVSDDPAACYITELRDIGLCREAMEEVLDRLSRSNSPGELSRSKLIWDTFIRSPRRLLWEYAALECKARPESCRVTVGRFLSGEVREFIDTHYPHCVEALEGAVLSIQAASLRAQGLPDVEGVFQRGAERLARAYGCGISEDEGTAMIEHTISEILSPDRGPSPEAWTWVPLDRGDQEPYCPALMVAERPGKAGRFIADPTRLPFPVLDGSFRKAMAGAWQYVASRWKPPEGRILVWSMRGLDPTRILVGRSAGAAAAAAMRAAIEGVRLNSGAAISACLDPGGRLGPVEKGQEKCRAARAAGCASVLFHPGSIPGHLEPEGLRVRLAIDFEEAWFNLRGFQEAIEAYRDAERAGIQGKIRFLDPEASGELTLLEALHVPFRILRGNGRSTVSSSVVHGSPPGRSGREIASRRRRTGAREAGGKDLGHAPPHADERLRPHERGQVEEFDRAFETWLAGKGTFLVVSADPGYGKTWLVSSLALRLLDELVQSGLSGRPAKSLFPLRMDCLELGETLARAKPDGRLPTLLEAAAEIIGARMAARGDRLVDALRSLIEDHFASGRLLLLIDGWDERDDAHDRVLLAGLGSWRGAGGRGSRILLTSRTPICGSGGLGSDAARWKLLPLEVPQGVADLVRRRFPRDPEKASGLTEHLVGNPELLQLVRVPLLGSIICWMAQEDEIPRAPPRRTQLLLSALRTLLDAGRVGSRDPAAVQRREGRKLATDIISILARLAGRTFTGERWTLTEEELVRALEQDPAVKSLGGAREVLEALTGRFGILTPAVGARFEILQQSFAELLGAKGVAESHGRDAAKFRRWLEVHGSARFLDHRLREVWCHLAALLPEKSAAVLVEVIWKTHRRGSCRPPPSAGEPRDDIFDSVLCLGGHCLAARPEGARTTAGRAIVNQIGKKLAEAFRSGREDERLAASAIALGRSGVGGGDRLLHLLRDPEPRVAARAAAVFGLLGPAAKAAIPALIDQALGNPHPKVAIACPIHTHGALLGQPVVDR